MILVCTQQFASVR